MDTVEKNTHRVRQTAFHVIFGRTAVIILLVIFQIILLIGTIRVAGRYATFTSMLLSFVLIIIVMNYKTQPAFSMTWVLLLSAFPVFGGLFFLFVKLQPMTGMVQKLNKKREEETRPFLQQDPEVTEHLRKTDARVAGMAEYLEKIGGYPVYQDSETRYLASGEALFEEMISQMEKAEHFIFVEFFIVAKGYMLDTMLEVLNKKVQEGVEVRFLYDGTNTLNNLSYTFPEYLTSLGIQCKVFAPVRPTLTTVQNNRNHQKIVVIDGKIGFTGGANIADEYINRKVRFGHWKDSGIEIRGKAVQSLTMIFLRMWNVSGSQSKLKKAEQEERFLEKIYGAYVTPPMPEIQSDSFVIPYSDNPFDNKDIGEHLYLDLLYTANRYVHITTPYLVIGYEMVQALIYAARRGVDVELILPHIPDKWYAFAVARTYYPELIGNGVKIFEYTPGFIHAKSFVCDDEKASVGTVNMDFRSLYLHFENGIFLFRDPQVQKVEDDFLETREKCREMTIEDYRNLPWYYRLSGRLLRLIAPLM